VFICPQATHPPRNAKLHKTRMGCRSGDKSNAAGLGHGDASHDAQFYTCSLRAIYI
jgi:hypothetical protein